MFDYNHALVKRAIKGDIDKNSIFYDLMKTLSPRSIGLKLQFYKGSQGVVAAGFDLERFQLNDCGNKANHMMKHGGIEYINIFYLKDKVLENKVLHERFEALTVLFKQTKNHNFDSMIRQLIDRLPLLVTDL